MPRADAYRAITRELLVRYLDGCAPPLLHGAKRLTYAEYAGAGAEPLAVAALGVFAEFTERNTHHPPRILVAGADPAGQRAVRAARDSLGLDSEPEFADGPLLAALRAAGSLGAPVLAFAELPPEAPERDGLLAALAGNAHSDALLVQDGGDPGAARTAGFGYSVAVELSADGVPPRLLLFGTNEGRHLDAVKDALWAADEYAGVRYRDPADPLHTPLDISLNPGLGPLRRLLLAALAAGPRTVGQLREHTRERTIYRPADAVRAVQALLHAGQVTRDPEHGRLASDTSITGPA
jgi:hypothetical protein